METKKLVITLPKELHDDFKNVAYIKNITMTDIIIEKIQEVVATEKEKLQQMKEIRK